MPIEYLEQDARVVVVCDSCEPLPASIVSEVGDCAECGLPAYRISTLGGARYLVCGSALRRVC
jgi:hypothetical protein